MAKPKRFDAVILVRMPSFLLKELSRHAVKATRTRSDVVREALHRFLKPRRA